ncbi:MAG: zinc metallopeptidase [Gammaproteobacteria bacterium]|jgi:Zn-dependent membrane protease YugP
MIFIYCSIILVIILVFGPQIWVRHVLKKYNTQIEQLPGTGGELAKHLIESLGLKGVTVNISINESNHYNPDNKVVSLAPEIYNGKSFTAISVATHEIGHAIQHMVKYKPLMIRCKLAQYVSGIEKAASIILFAFPVIVLVTHLPAAGMMLLVLGLGLLLVPVGFHLITLPVELDASFQRALPILINGNYVPNSAIPIINRVLFAAALTYVSASLASILNFYRWVNILKR